MKFTLTRDNECGLMSIEGLLDSDDCRRNTLGGLCQINGSYYFSLTLPYSNLMAFTSL